MNMRDMNIDINEFKKGGFLQQKQKEYFIMRIRTLGGNLTTTQLGKISELADNYGRGYVHLTTRQGVEIPFVKLEDYNEVRRELLTSGLLPGACGPRVRSVIGCPGNEVCKSGLVNARQMAVWVDETFFGRDVPSKTKIAVSGCPNSCAKPQENDIGVLGVIKPKLNKDKCLDCGLCVHVCPTKALTMVDGIPVMDQAKCIHDGKCIASCPVDAWEEVERGYNLYSGGKIGREPQLGQVIGEFIPEGKVVSAIEAVLETYQELHNKGERIAKVINRVGIDKFKENFNKNFAEREAVINV